MPNSGNESVADATAATHRADYPNVAAWLSRAEKRVPRHWLLELLDVERVPADVENETDEQHEPTPSVVDRLLALTEAMIKAVRSANPAGLGEMTKGFQDSDPARILSVRLELACAANLALRQIPFAVGGKGQPDLVWHPGTELRGWVEIHRGAFDPFGSLTADLEAALAAESATVTVHVDDWPVDFPEKNVVFSTIMDAAKASSPAIPVWADLPQLGDGVRVLAERRLNTFATGPSRIFVQHSELVPTSHYLQGVADRLVSKVDEKSGQARKGQWEPRTVVLVDISSAHLMRMLDGGALAAWLSEVSFDWEEVPFAAVAVSMTDLVSPWVAGFYRYRPGLPEGEQAKLEPILSGLLLSPASSR